MKYLVWALSIIAAIIMGQTLYFKFTGQPESIALFTRIGMEPNGRIMVGVFELVACLLLIIPQTRIYGALLGMFLMAGAIKYHLFDIGIRFYGSYTLFIYALVVFLCCAGILLLEWKKLRSVFLSFSKRKK